MAAASSSSKPLTISENQEFLEVKSVSLEWKLSNLKHIFDSSKGDAKSKCVKSAFFGDGKWQVFFYPNSGHDQYCSLYLSCQPTSEEIEKGATQAPSSTTSTNGQQKTVDPAQVPWQREGLFKFTFEIKSLDRRTTYKTMEANDHAFSHEARNWGWAQYWRRNDAFYSNPSAKYNDAFLVCCTIVYSPIPPVNHPTAQALKRSIPLDLLQAYSSLFNDPTYADVCFNIIRPRPGSKKHSVRRLYASKKILTRRSEYFATMFDSGFAESVADWAPMKLVQLDVDGTRPKPVSDEEEDELMNEDSDDELSSSLDGDESGPGEEAFSTSSVPDDEQDVPGPKASPERVGSADTHPSPRRDEGIVSAEVVEAAPAIVVEDETLAEPITESPVSRRISVIATVKQDTPSQSRSVAGSPSQKPASSFWTIGSRQKKHKNKEAQIQARTVVEVTDAAYTTFKALLFFLYTDSITFAPLSSTYYCLKDDAEARGVCFEYGSRREFVEASIGGRTSCSCRGSGPQEVVCSAKAIYRLADKLNLIDLKSRAYDHITRSLTVQNIPMEVFSAFTSAFDEIRKVEVDFMLCHWNELRDGEPLKKVLASSRLVPEVWSLLLSNLEYKPAPVAVISNAAGGGGGQVTDVEHRSIDAA